MPGAEGETLETLLRGFAPIGALVTVPQAAASASAVLTVVGKVVAKAVEAIVAISASVAAAGFSIGIADAAEALDAAEVVVSFTSLPATEENTSSQTPPWVKRGAKKKQGANSSRSASARSIGGTKNVLMLLWFLRYKV